MTVWNRKYFQPRLDNGFLYVNCPVCTTLTGFTEWKKTMIQFFSFLALHTCEVCIMRSHYLKQGMRFILWAFRQCYQMMKFHATHWARPVSNLYTGRSCKSSDKILPKKIPLMCLILSNYLLKHNIILVDCKQNPQRWLHCWVLKELAEWALLTQPQR